MIRAVTVPEFAATWEDVLEAFIEACFMFAATDGRMVASDGENVLIVDLPRGCVPVLEWGFA